MTLCAVNNLDLRPWLKDRFLTRYFSQNLVSNMAQSSKYGQTIQFFTRLFSRIFNYSYFHVYERKIFTTTNICLSKETLMRMLSLDFLDKVAKQVDFHSTTILLLGFILTKIKLHSTSLNFSLLYSNHSTRWPNGLMFSSNFCGIKH